MERLQSTISVLMTLISPVSEAIGALACPSCAVLMNLHQPEVGFPGRMLWTCEGCGGWSLMDLDLGGDVAVLVSLPDSGYFLKAIGR